MFENKGKEKYNKYLSSYLDEELNEKEVEVFEKMMEVDPSLKKKHTLWTNIKKSFFQKENKASVEKNKDMVVDNIMAAISTKPIEPATSKFNSQFYLVFNCVSMFILIALPALAMVDWEISFRISEMVVDTSFNDKFMEFFLAKQKLF